MSFTVISSVGLFAVGAYMLKRYSNGAVYKGQGRIDGKVVIVTGANSGIGKETAMELVNRGGKVYMACRSLERAHVAADEIKQKTGVGDDRVIVMQLDVSSLSSVRNFATSFKTKEKKLDILINNAGATWIADRKTVDGFESIFATNHLGPFLLTVLLLDMLTSDPGSRARVVNVSSAAHCRASPLDHDDVTLSGRSYRPTWTQYPHSKLANVLFTRELARRLGPQSLVSVYALHPGLVRTDFFRNHPWYEQCVIAPFSWLVCKEPWYGAQTTVYCAVDDSVERETGKYYSECAESTASKHACDEAAARRLWTESVRLVRLSADETHPSLLS